MHTNFFILLFMLSAALTAGEFAIVRNGAPAASVEYPHDLATQISEFSSHLKKISGVDLPSVKKSGSNKITFRIKQTDIMHEDEFEITFPDAHTMQITGTKLSITRALNYILENHCGVIFCMPGPYGTYYPQKSNVSLPVRDIKKTASFKLFRHNYLEDPAWEQVLGGKGSLISGCNFFTHNLYRILPVEKYSRPEWREKIMPFINGKRAEPKSETDWQPCFSNPESIDEAIKNICEYLDKHSNEKLFSLGVNDNQGFCRCGNCIKANGGLKKAVYNNSYYNFSPLYYTWANRVIEGVVKKHPDVYFGCLAYCETIDPPPFKLHPHLIPFLCTEIYQNVDGKLFETRKKMLEAWADKASSLGFWEYGYGMSYHVPRVYHRLQKKMLKLYADNKGQAYFAEGESFIGEGPKRYLSLKLLLDVDADADKILKEWYEACVGKEAAPHLERYFTVWENFWAGENIRKTKWFKPGDVYLSFSDPSYLAALTEKELSDAKKAIIEMNAAAQKSGNADQKIRAQRLFDTFLLYEARAYAHGAFVLPLDFKLKTEEEVLKYLSGVGRMAEYSGKIQGIAERIAEYKKKEKFTASGIQTAALYFISKDGLSYHLNEIAAFSSSPQVRKAIGNAIKYPTVDKLFGNLRALGRLHSALNLLDQKQMIASPENEIWEWRYSQNVKIEMIPSRDGTAAYKITSKGGWCAAQRLVKLRPNRLYSFTARVWLPRGICNTRPILACCSRNTLSLSKAAATELVTASKQPVTLRHLETTTDKTYRGKLFIIFPGLPEGECAYVDNLVLRDLSDRETVWTYPGGSKFTADNKEWTLAGNAKIVDDSLRGTVLLLGPGGSATSKTEFVIDPTKDFPRLSSDVSGKGTFALDLTLPDGSIVYKDSINSNHILSFGNWENYEYEPILGMLPKKMVRVKMRIRAVSEDAKLSFDNFRCCIERIK